MNTSNNAGFRDPALYNGNNTNLGTGPGVSGGVPGGGGVGNLHGNQGFQNPGAGHGVTDTYGNDFTNTAGRGTGPHGGGMGTGTGTGGQWFGSGQEFSSNATHGTAIPPSNTVHHGPGGTGHGANLGSNSTSSSGGTGQRLTGKVESAMGTMLGSSALKAKGLQKEQEANSVKLQGSELAEAERLEREALMRRERAVAHGAHPANSQLGAGHLSDNNNI